MQSLRDLLEQRDLGLLDCETNGDLENLRSPLSHASLIAQFLLESSPAS
jgi:hypothetical protein